MSCTVLILVFIAVIEAALVATLSCTVLILVSVANVALAYVPRVSRLVALVAALAETVPIAFVRVTDRLASLPKAAAISLRVSRVAGALSTRPATSVST